MELVTAFTMEQDIPDYDMDSEDERWLAVHTKNLEINELKVSQANNILTNSGIGLVYLILLVR